MSNSHSKMSEVKYFEHDDDDYDYVTNDKLVLCFEEIDVDTKKMDMVCYVLYDQNEHEYYICGKRQSGYNDFKFFCKSKRNVIRMLKNIMDFKHNEINHVLYNYNDVFLDEYGVEYEYIDYYTLWDTKQTCKEISAFDNVTYNESNIKSLLSVIKNVRY